VKKPNLSLALVLCALIPFLAVRIIAAEDIFPLKDIGPTVDELVNTGYSDASELAYVSARGCALLCAISINLEDNPGGERDVKQSIQFRTFADSYLRFAIFNGLKSRKSEEMQKAQIQMLIEIYMKEMIRSKQLNNEYLSSTIRRDLKDIERIAPLVNAFSKMLDEQGHNPPVEDKSKP
jgi:hypothetical protein